VTGFVLSANVAVVAPAATVTDAGTVATLVLLLANVTTAPPAPAAVDSITVPVLPAPPVNTEGFSVIEARAGLTTSPAVLETPLKVAVMVTTVPDVTVLVVTAKVAVVAPAAT